MVTQECITQDIPFHQVHERRGDKSNINSRGGLPWSGEKSLGWPLLIHVKELFREDVKRKFPSLLERSHPHSVWWALKSPSIMQFGNCLQKVVHKGWSVLNKSILNIFT